MALSRRSRRLGLVDRAGDGDGRFTRAGRWSRGPNWVGRGAGRRSPYGVMGRSRRGVDRVVRNLAGWRVNWVGRSRAAWGVNWVLRHLGAWGVNRVRWHGAGLLLGAGGRRWVLRVLDLTGARRVLRVLGSLAGAHGVGRVFRSRSVYGIRRVLGSGDWVVVVLVVTGHGHGGSRSCKSEGVDLHHIGNECCWVVAMEVVDINDQVRSKMQ